MPFYYRINKNYKHYMKTVIISDINSKSDSVIPYGLNLAKHLESEVDVLHIIDTRIQQGKYSSVSDSQSITPGSKLSPEEFLQKEKNKARLNLDKILSAEVSRLNYPLKVHTAITQNIIEDELKQRSINDKESLFIINSEPDNYMFSSKNDILSTIKNTGIIALIIDPGIKFKPFERVFIPMKFGSEKYNAYARAQFLFKHFDMTIDAVDIAKKKDYMKIELKAARWKKSTRKDFSPANLATHIMEGKDRIETLSDYMGKNNHDLMMFFKKKENLINRIFKPNKLELLVNQTNIPVLLHYFH